MMSQKQCEKGVRKSMTARAVFGRRIRGLGGRHAESKNFSFVSFPLLPLVSPNLRCLAPITRNERLQELCVRSSLKAPVDFLIFAVVFISFGCTSIRYLDNLHILLQESMASQQPQVGKHPAVQASGEIGRADAEATDFYSRDRAVEHGAPQLVGGQYGGTEDQVQYVGEGKPVTWMQHWKTARRGWLAYVKTKDFWIVLVLGLVTKPCQSSMVDANS